ncbi:MAG: hypothetical protein ACI9UK_000207 [Candidatus Krumholzibacteriia bacterium]|jgi:hypothetical protein
MYRRLFYLRLYIVENVVEGFDFFCEKIGQNTALRIFLCVAQLA